MHLGSARALLSAGLEGPCGTRSWSTRRSATTVSVDTRPGGQVARGTKGAPAQRTGEVLKDERRGGAASRNGDADE
jgi:hypothetical protein